MTTTEPNPIGEPLSSIFPENWDIFTVDFMDGKAVDSVLMNASPPQNAAHVPTLSGIKKAAEDFCADNGLELLKAVELLEGK